MISKIPRQAPLLIISLFVTLGVASCGGGSSGSGAGTSGAPAACYAVNPAVGAESFEWPGGVGPERPEVHNNASCSAPSGSVADVVVAVNETQALDRCPDRANGSVDQLTVDPPVAAPASFFACEP